MYIKILIPIIILIIIYLFICYRDLYKINMVKYLPKWGWSIIIIISIPLGGVIYFLFGRETRGDNG
ncbi:hypothetical protein GZH82_02075 [Staphylococcus ursi]|uniref:hypothetical protein n=1 Tax=Staphylococcus sp. MI 10-1553 TaxID=1912064 RepID=UPI001396DB16|nr:hypothetical protein [Staphylococcus sp. MI 10-1553]QHW36236.1 hypothetical protein GZH82_02075 [Staphylococcus sp. MI 10-1553]